MARSETNDLGGLSHRLADRDGIVIEPAWARALSGHQIVGSCRMTGCDGYLRATHMDHNGKTAWYEAECMKCLHIYASPGGRTLPRSSRHQEMPDGAWERRVDRLKALFGPRGMAA